MPDRLQRFTMIFRAIQYYFSAERDESRSRYEADTTPATDICWEAYMGRWYEWARYETPFEYGMDNVYTEYEATAADRVSICNYGTDAAGKKHCAKAKATVAGEGMLNVSFIPIFRFLSTPYHVLYTDSAYSTALVSNASGSCLWLLGRVPIPSESAYAQLVREALQRGFRTDTLRLTRHTS